MGLSVSSPTSSQAVQSQLFPHHSSLDPLPKSLSPGRVENPHDILLKADRFTLSPEDPTVKELQESVVSLRATLGEKDPRIAAKLDELGSSYFRLGKLGEAIECHVEALDIYRDRYGDNSPNVAAGLCRLAQVYSLQQNHTFAISCHKQEVEILMRLHGVKDPLAALGLKRLGRAYVTGGYYEAAIAAFNLVHPILKPLEEYKIDLLSVLCSLVETYACVQNLIKAKDVLEEAFLLWSGLDSKEQEEHPSVLILKGAFDRDKGLKEQSLIYLHQALNFFNKKFGEENPGTAETQYELGLTYHSIGDHDEAEDCLRKALKFQEKFYEKGHPIRVRTESALGSKEPDRKRQRN